MKNSPYVKKNLLYLFKTKGMHCQLESCGDCPLGNVLSSPRLRCSHLTNSQLLIKVIEIIIEQGYLTEEEIFDELL